MNLGQLIKILKKHKQENYIEFDFAGAIPTKFYSWRGNYSQLGLCYKPRDYMEGITVAEFIEKCEKCIGETFEGWKGGEYVMGKSTDIYVVSDWGNCYPITAITDVKTDGYTVYLMTEV